jgi:hypothetical protein
VQPSTQAADAAADDGVRVTATHLAGGVTVYGLWINWKECLEGYPDERALFQACDSQFIRLEPACELGVHAFVTGVGLKKGSINRVKLAQQFTWGQTVFEAGISLFKVGNACCLTALRSWVRA